MTSQHAHVFCLSAVGTPCSQCALAGEEVQGPVHSGSSQRGVVFPRPLQDLVSCTVARTVRQRLYHSPTRRRDAKAFGAQEFRHTVGHLASVLRHGINNVHESVSASKWRSCTWPTMCALDGVWIPPKDLRYTGAGGVRPVRDALLMDLYELTMASSYLRRGLNDRATFAYFVRAPVPDRRFLVFAGLAELLRYVEELRFTEDDLAYLSRLNLFDEAFLTYLKEFRFSGDLWAVDEGEIVFPGVPLLVASGPRVEVQLIETFLLNALNFQTLIASKAARMLLAAGPDARVVDFSARRDHGTDAAVQAARASYLTGFHGTSNVLAGQRLGIPVVGTMAHSYVMSFPDELSAFRAFAADHPQPVLLIDTYDTLQGAANAAIVAKELRAQGRSLAGVRLDSGDLAAESRAVAALFAAEGLPEVSLFVSGDLDEHRIAAFRAAGGVAGGYGVGTRLGVSWDVPALGGVYKLVEDTAGPRMKRSPGKLTLPGRPQVWRSDDPLEDTVALADEVLPGRPLLRCVMREGQSCARPPGLQHLRSSVRSALFALAEALRALDPDARPAYPVRLSEPLKALRDRR